MTKTRGPRATTGNLKNEKDTKAPEFRFSNDEYNSLRTETIERIRMMNNQASNAFGIILTIWAAGFSIMGFNIINVGSLSTNAFIALICGQICAFLASIVMLLPMAIKSGENLKQLVSLSTYMLVFYGYLAARNGDYIYTWDIVDKRSNNAATTKGKKRFWIKRINAEYSILGLTSFSFIIISTVYGGLHLQNDVPKTILIVVGIAIVSLSLYFLVIIYKCSNVIDNMMNLSDDYLKRDLIIAAEMGLLNRDEVKKAYEELNVGKTISIEEYQKYFD